MLLDNPFESGHIKNYLLLYASIVVIMILFFIASSLYNDIEDVDIKLFNVKKRNDGSSTEIVKEVEKTTPKFKLLDKAY